MEVRRVPPDWEHPRDTKAMHVPLLGGSFSRIWREWRAESLAWRRGLHPSAKQFDGTFLEWSGGEPVAAFYMPDWECSDATCFQIYETVTEGTPLSPVFSEVSMLASWAARNIHTRTDQDGKHYRSAESWLLWIEDQIDSRK